MSEIEVRALSPSPDSRERLGDMLAEVVAGGGSAGFMHPLTPELAAAYGTARWPPPLAASGSSWAPGMARPSPAR